jgi:hypothetical protein
MLKDPYPLNLKPVGQIVGFIYHNGSSIQVHLKIWNIIVDRKHLIVVDFPYQ